MRSSSGEINIEECIQTQTQASWLSQTVLPSQSWKSKETLNSKMARHKGNDVTPPPTMYVGKHIL